MNTNRLLANLNPEQREAVTLPTGPALVLAGAGSGKTRVLVHRIAWRIETEDTPPQSVLAVTFTNKAAREMRARVLTLVGPRAQSMWLGTFHSMAYRILSRHAREAGLRPDFTILDEDDQRRLIRQLIRERQWDEREFPPALAQWYINQKKDAGMRASQVPDGVGREDRALRDLYQGYEMKLRSLGAADFAELLFCCHDLWQKQPALLESYQARFREILVDEFQDTNTLQYLWFRTLTGTSGNPFVVGDDDQAIYGWRGGRVEHVLRFPKDFEGTRVIRLEQNYRSSGAILSAANALIAHNPSRLGKTLWTASETGERPVYFTADDELEEADYIVTRIQQALSGGQPAGTIAILYRSNAQSRVIEESLVRHEIAYRIYGGVRFFERSEIKDTLAYLRLMTDPENDSAFERVFNVPTRGLGDRTFERVREHARQEGRSLAASALAIAQPKAVSADRSARALRGFLELLADMREAIRPLNLAGQVERVIALSRLAEFYQTDDPLRAETRIESLAELVNAAAGYEPDPEMESTPAEFSGLMAFLGQMALATEPESRPGKSDEIQLMSLHAAKGLEFHTVFITGLEEGLLPHSRATETAGGLEEERRLFYVGITRAERQLYLTRARRRRLHGHYIDTLPSRFLLEIPADQLESGEPRIVTRTARSRVQHRFPNTDPGLPVTIGQRVRHPRFGEGVVLSHEGSGDHCRIHVRFEGSGAKWLLWDQAHLETLES
ncbi:MAG: UvrD-helicase domain-containing protein [Gammaproteobacteria bacterium]